MKICKFIALVVSLFFVSVGAHAQTKKTAPMSASLVVAILDLSSIRRESLVVKNVNEQIVVFRNGFRKSIKTEESALKAASQELAKKRNLLTPEEFAKKRREFEQKVVAVQRLVQQSKQALTKSRAKAMVVVEKTLNKIITKIALERNINIILRRDVTILASRSLEITADVLKALNVQLPKVTVKKPVTK